LSNELTSLKTLDGFGLRFDIEENFLDDKSTRFQLEPSQIWGATASLRLTLIMAVAMIYLVSGRDGCSGDELSLLRQHHWHRGLSYFQIGWRWIEHALIWNTIVTLLLVRNQSGS
jgi:hypothetical protein